MNEEAGESDEEEEGGALIPKGQVEAPHSMVATVSDEVGSLWASHLISDPVFLLC